MFVYLYCVIKFYSRTATHSENNTSTVQTVLTPNLTKVMAEIVTQATNNRNTPTIATLKRTNSVSVKTREFQNIFSKTSSNNSISDINSNITGIFLLFFNRYIFLSF